MSICSWNTISIFTERNRLRSLALGLSVDCHARGQGPKIQRPKTKDQRPNFRSHRKGDGWHPCCSQLQALPLCRVLSPETSGTEAEVRASNLTSDRFNVCAAQLIAATTKARTGLCLLTWVF